MLHPAPMRTHFSSDATQNILLVVKHIPLFLHDIHDRLLSWLLWVVYMI